PGLEVTPSGFLPGVAEGTLLLAGQPGNVGPGQDGDSGPDGLVIENVSDYQNRLPHPKIKIISTLFWKDQGEAEPMVPVKIQGHPYIVSTDEEGGAGGTIPPGGLRGAGGRRAAPPAFPPITAVPNPRPTHTIS